jgi:hypothetical protein
VVVHKCNPSTQEAEAGRSQVQPGLHSETDSKYWLGTVAQ